MSISPFDTIDELEDEFTSDNFSIIEDLINSIHEARKLGEFDYDDWNETIRVWYEDLYLVEKKQNRTSSTFGFNEIQTHFIFYNLYKLIGNEDKALEHVKLAHQFYKKNTISYQWENIVYKVFKEIYGQSVEPDCILPNNKRPDLVINPTYHEFKYHPRGSKIIKAEKIIDMKTNNYGIKKELTFYRDYCDELIVVHLEGVNNEYENITFISSEKLIEMISEEANIIFIKTIQSKIKLGYIIKEFNRRKLPITTIKKHIDLQ